MKRTLCMLAAALTFTCAMAQNECKKDQQCEGQCPDRTEMMVKEFGLDDAQAAKLKALNEKYPDLNGPRRMGPPPARRDSCCGKADANEQPTRRRMPPSKDMKEKMEQRRQQREAYEQELKAIMTDDQFAAYQKKQEEMRSRRPGGPRR